MRQRISDLPRASRRWLAGGLSGLMMVFLAACGDAGPETFEGRPDGPYRMSFAADPAPLRAARVTRLTSSLRRTADGTAVTGLTVTHQRLVHNFIVKLDFTSFAHIHHEDFAPLPGTEVERADLSFPYTFPRSGHYRIVSEFVHQQRAWTQHFDLLVGDAAVPQVKIDLARDKLFAPYRARLSTSPARPVAGYETELVLELQRDQQAVTDLELYLGSEVHVALWRIDGNHFGHTHAWTPHMAAMMAGAYDREADPATRARRMENLMAEMSNMPVEQVFFGPYIPIHYVFAAAGTYALFLQCAPGGDVRVFDFMIEVADHHDGMETRIDSILDGSTAHGEH